MKIINFFKRERVNTGRLTNLDLLKAISVIFMVIGHTVIYLDFETETFAYKFADNFLATIIGVAHGFMLIMGVGLVFGKRNTPKLIFLRGVKMLIIGYLLNFFRLGIYYLCIGDIDQFLYYSLSTDIFPFVGVALMLTALFKKLKIPNIFIFLIAVIMSCTAPLFHSLQTGDYIIDSLLCVLVPLGNEAVYGFNLFSWYIYVAFGMLFADIISRIKNLDKFYLYMLIPSSLLSIGYLFFYFMSPYGPYADVIYYYGCGIVNAIGFLSIDMLLISVFHFVSKKIDINKLKFITFLSKHITIVYVIHWLILGPMVFVAYTQEKFSAGLKWYVAYLVGIAILILSMIIAKLYLYIKNRIMGKKA